MTNWAQGGPKLEDDQTRGFCSPINRPRFGKTTKTSQVLKRFVRIARSVSPDRKQDYQQEILKLTMNPLSSSPYSQLLNLKVGRSMVTQSYSSVTLVPPFSVHTLIPNYIPSFYNLFTAFIPLCSWSYSRYMRSMWGCHCFTLLVLLPYI